MIRAVTVALGLLAAAAPSHALSIRNSKHDLSASSATTGPKATTEGELCIFCHTAHKADPNVPLWNHTQTTQTFTFYASNYLNTYLGVTAPTMAALAGTRTKLCLSCHDGVTALGGVYNVNGAPATLAMTGPLGAAANLGTSLADDHPVLYAVDPARDPEIQLPAVGDPVKVYGAGNVVECTSCHDPHDNGKNAYGKFLVKSNANAAVCTTCHVKTGWAASVHATAPAAYTPPGYPATTVGEWACRDCHQMHGGSTVQAYLLKGAEENTCFNCHNTPAMKNIQVMFGYAFRHPTTTVSGIHRDPETDASNFTVTPNRRHAECPDCHNPHRAQPGNRLAKPVPNNLISNALLGQWGVEPTYGAVAWTPPASWTRVVFTDTVNYKENQLCLKCHSAYAYGGTPPVGYTDQSIELNPLNSSRHPVLAPGNNPYCTPTATNGNRVTMVAPWNQTANEHDTMFCADCHGSDTGTDPEGPHGSAQQAILQASLMATIPAGYANYATPLCIRCHSPAVYADNNGNTLGSRYQHQVNGGMSVAPNDPKVGGEPYGGCLMCHGNLTSGVNGTFHGLNGSWTSNPMLHFLGNTMNFVDWDQTLRQCTTQTCHVHTKTY